MEEVRERVYEKNTGAVLLDVRSDYMLDIPEDEGRGKDLAGDMSILMPYTYKKIIEAVFRCGAMTKNAIKNLLANDTSLTAELRSEGAVDRYMDILCGKGYIYKCSCYRTEGDKDYIRYDYYIIPPSLAQELEMRCGKSFKDYLVSPERVSKLLSISQFATLFCDGDTDLIRDARSGILTDSDEVCLRFDVRGMRLYIASMRKGARDTRIKLLSDLSKKLNGRLESTRGVIVCENMSSVRRYADETLKMLKSSQLHGIYFTYDFTYTDRNPVLLAAERTTDGLKLIPVGIFDGGRR